MVAKQPEWEAIERAYRAGSLSIKSTARCNGICGNYDEVHSAEFDRRIAIMSWQIREAVPGDFRSLVRVDSVAEKDDGRRAQIASAISKGHCWVACGEDDPAVPVGYGCLDRSFFGEWFVPLVIVSNAHRRCGIGRKIIAHLERCSSAKKIFTSTNTSNTPMRQLLAQLGYQSSGVVENLDPGDPELIFMKVLDE